MRNIRIVIVAVLAAIVAAAGWWSWSKTGQRQMVAAALPPIPDLSAGSAAYREAVSRAAARARSWLHARAGLAELSALYHANGQFDEAVRCYEALEQLDPSEPRWRHRHAVILAGYGDIEPAAALWRRVQQLAPDYVPARLRLADCELKTNQLDAAATAYTAVLQRNPDNSYAQLGLARIDFERGRFEAARSRLESLVSQTNFQLGYDLIVSVYERLGQNDRALAIRSQNKASGAYRDPPDPWVDDLLKVCFDPYRLSLTAGLLAGAGGDSTTAIELLQRAIDLAPGDVSARFQLGMVYAKQQNLNAAYQQLEQCTRLQPTFSDAWARLSDVQTQLGEKSAAARTLAEGLRQCPDSPALHVMQARALQAAGRTDEAISEYQRSLVLRPNEAAGYAELGNLYILIGRPELGIEQMRAALVAEPGYPQALAVLAFYEISTGNRREADTWMSRVADQPRVPRDTVARLTEAYRNQFGSSWQPKR